MCLLIVLRSVLPSHPVVVAGNRDELRARPSAPPGLWVGRRRLVLCPRDRLQDGTWMGVNDRGVFAGLTNITGAPVPPQAVTRGRLPLLALDEDSLAAGTYAVEAAVSQAAYAGFQLVLCDGERTVVLRHEAGRLECTEWLGEVAVLTNEHTVGTLDPARLQAALGSASAGLDPLLQALRSPLLYDGHDGGYAVLKRGAEYGTVSSSLVAVPPGAQGDLQWWFAAGSPDEVDYRSYGNLVRRLHQDAKDLEPDRDGW